MIELNYEGANAYYTTLEESILYKVNCRDTLLQTESWESKQSVRKFIDYYIRKTNKLRAIAIDITEIASDPVEMMYLYSCLPIDFDSLDEYVEEHSKLTYYDKLIMTQISVTVCQHCRSKHLTLVKSDDVGYEWLGGSEYCHNITCSKCELPLNGNIVKLFTLEEWRTSQVSNS